MRFILAIVAVCVLSVPVLAAPGVGDKIHQVGQATVNGVTVPVTFDKEVVAFDAGAQQFTVRSTTTVSGEQPNVSDSTTAAANMYGHDALQGVLANCAGSGSTRATITIGAQSFDTCAIAFNQNGCTGTVWVGDVPFAVVKEKASCPSQGITDLEFPGGPTPEITYQWAQGL